MNQIVEKRVICPKCGKKISIDVEVPLKSSNFLIECSNAKCDYEFIVKASYYVDLEVYSLKKVKNNA